MTEGDEDISDRLNLSGPLTVEAVLRTLQERFMDGQCYVSAYSREAHEEHSFVFVRYLTPKA